MGIGKAQDFDLPGPRQVQALAQMLEQVLKVVGNVPVPAVAQARQEGLGRGGGRSFLLAGLWGLCRLGNLALLGPFEKGLDIHSVVGLDLVEAQAEGQQPED